MEGAASRTVHASRALRIEVTGAFLKLLAMEPPIKPGTPDPYTPPKPGALRAETHLQIGPIIQYVTSLVRSHDEAPDPDHGMHHASG
jgi:hypothetical protein